MFFVLYKSLYVTYKKSHKNNKFKISASTWNEKFELLGGSYCISDIQDCFERILKKYGEKTINPSIRMYVNEIENRITFNIKTGYYIEFLIPKTKKLLASTKSKTANMKMVKMWLI